MHQIKKLHKDRLSSINSKQVLEVDGNYFKDMLDGVMAELRIISQKIDNKTKDEKLLDYNSTRRQPRFQNIDVPIPTWKFFSQQQLHNNIKQWLGVVCGDIFSIGFKLFHQKEFGTRKLKSYCSENLLRNIIKLIHTNSLNTEQVALINQYLKKTLFPYFSLKYPMSEQADSTIRFANQIIEKDHLANSSNDLIFKSNIKFRKSQNGNYNKQIMQFLNYVIELPNKPLQNKGMVKITVEGMLNVNSNQPQKKLATLFFEDMQDLFKMVESKSQSIRMLKFDPHSPQKLCQQTEKKVSTKQNIQEQIEYEEKVKSYTQYLIGQKISENTPTYKNSQISAGNLRLFNPAIRRIVTKWCEQLLRNFDQTYILQYQNQFRMQDGKLRYLKMSDLIILSEILHLQKIKIQKYLDQVMKNNYENQSFLGAEKVHPDLKILCADQAIVGEFSSILYKNNQNYLIKYLNSLIHGITCSLETYKKFLYAQSLNKEDVNQKIKDFYDGKIKIIELIQKIQQIETPQNYVSILYKTPQLINFKVGDLLRCKCSSQQNQIRALYKQLERISFCAPDLIKIIRLKNRLNKGTKDILLNLMYRQTLLVEVQLAIKTKTTQFIKNSNQFSHYLYELERAQFGPLSQLCSIWINNDLRSRYYIDFFEKNNLRISEKQKINKCCLNKQNHQNILLPFKCSGCFYHYSDCNSFISNLKCKKCKSKICALCYLQNIEYPEMQKFIPYLSKFLGDSKAQDFPKISKTIPEYGLIISLNSMNIQPKFFRTIKKDSKIYLLTIKKNILIQKDENSSKLDEIYQLKANSKHQIEQFMRQNLILIHSDYDKRIPMVNIDDANNRFFIPSYMSQIKKSHNPQIVLMEKNLSDKVFQKELTFPHVSKINFMNNKIANLKSLCQAFPNLELGLLSSNRIQSIPSEISTWKNKIKRLHLKKNNISHIHPNISQLQELVILELNGNRVCELPPEIGKLGNLRKLWVRQNKLKRLPEEISDLKQLKEILLDFNQIVQLPQSFSQLISLKKMMIRGNKLQKLPQDLYKIDGLQYINCADNRISFLDQQFGKLAKLADLKIQRNQLKSLPKQFCRLKHLKALNLTKNKLQQLPEKFYELSSLEICNLSQNQLQDINIFEHSMPKLHELYLQKNNLSKLTGTLQSQKQLIILNLQSNKLTDVPQQFFDSYSLETLLLCKNKFSEFPKIKGLNIKKLSINENQIDQINKNIEDLESLQNLQLSSNQIKHIGLQLLSLQKLKRLDISGNPLQTICKEFKNFGMKLQNLQIDKQILGDEAKKIIEEYGSHKI